MSSFISWVKKYPMTMLLIICCLIGGPYFSTSGTGPVAQG